MLSRSRWGWLRLCMYGQSNLIKKCSAHRPVQSRVYLSTRVLALACGVGLWQAAYVDMTFPNLHCNIVNLIQGGRDKRLTFVMFSLIVDLVIVANSDKLIMAEMRTTWH